MPLNDQELELARSHFNEEEAKTLTAEDAFGKLCEKFVALSKIALEQEKKLEASEKTLAASTIDPDALELIVSSTKDAIQGLVTSGKIVPAVAKKLELALIGDVKNPNIFALSRQASKTPKAIAASIIEALKDNDPVALGEKTKAQTVALTREVPGAEKETEDVKVAKAMDEVANKGRGSKKAAK
jgi:hypothetical protein